MSTEHQLYEDLAEAMRRRSRAQTALVKWEETLHDAETDIRELSSRIAQEYGSFAPASAYEQTVPNYDVPVNNGVDPE